MCLRSFTISPTNIKLEHTVICEPAHKPIGNVLSYELRNPTEMSEPLVSLGNTIEPNNCCPLWFVSNVVLIGCLP